MTMKKRCWPIILCLFFLVALSFASGYAVKAQECPQETTATLSEESINELAAACLAGCSLVPMPNNCPDPCQECLPCPQQGTPCKPGDVLIVPPALKPQNGPYRLELTLAATDTHEAAFVQWRPRKRLWRLTGVGLGVLNGERVELVPYAVGQGSIKNHLKWGTERREWGNTEVAAVVSLGILE